MGSQPAPHSDLKVLIGRGAPRSLALGCVVLVTDAAANGYGNCVLDSSQGATAGRTGQSAITALAVALLAAASGYGLVSPPSIPLTLCHKCATGPCSGDGSRRAETGIGRLTCADFDRDGPLEPATGEFRAHRS